MAYNFGTRRFADGAPALDAAHINDALSNLNGDASAASVAAAAGLTDTLANHLGALASARQFPAIGKRRANLIADFGAKGDGTDDSVAIQAAMDAVTARGGGIVEVPPLAFGIGPAANGTAGILWRKGVILEGHGGFQTGDTAAPFIKGSVFRATASLASMFTQASMTAPLNSAGMRGVTVDAGKSAGFTVGTALLLSFINGRFEANHILNGTGDGLANKVNPVAAWVNWIEHNWIERFDGVGLRWEGTDSYIANNYLSWCQGANLRVDGTGGNQIVGNMLDLAGAGPTGIPAANNPNTPALILTNATTAAMGGVWLQSSNAVSGNHFGENAYDILIPASIYGTLTTPHSITGNLFHNCGSNNVTIGVGNQGGSISGNTFAFGPAGGAGVVFATDTTASNAGRWSLGPNSFMSMTGAYVNAPTGTSITGYS